MQKKLIALAVAGLAAAPVFAQTHVTVYGVVDTSVESVKATGATAGGGLEARTRISSNSSHIGFKGVEELGNGVKALFQFEQGVNSDIGGFGGARDTFVGLSSGWGTVVLGNLTHPIRTMGAKVDFNPGATTIGFTGLYGYFGNIKSGSDDRAPNALAYVSPSLGGFTLTAAYVASAPNSVTVETRAGDRKPFQWQLAAQYDNGPAYFGLGYHRAEDPFPSNDNRLTVLRAAGKYTLGTGTSISALWDRQEVKENVPASSKVKRDAWMLGLNQNFGAHNVWAQYAKMGDLKGDCANCGDTGAKQWTLGYSYSLSKRTMLHAYYSDLKNDAASAVDFYVNPVGVAAATAGADPRGFGLGLRHAF